MFCSKRTVNGGPGPLTESTLFPHLIGTAWGRAGQHWEGGGGQSRPRRQGAWAVGAATPPPRSPRSGAPAEVWPQGLESTSLSRSPGQGRVARGRSRPWSQEVGAGPKWGLKASGILGAHLGTALAGGCRCPSPPSPPRQHHSSGSGRAHGGSRGGRPRVRDGRGPASTGGACARRHSAPRPVFFPPPLRSPRPRPRPREPRGEPR